MYIWYSFDETNGFLRRNLSQCSRDLKELAYFSLARSVLEYACQVWDPHTKKNIAKLEQVQHRAARFAMSDYSTYSSVTAMFSQLQWETLSARRKNHRLALMHQIVNKKVAIPADDILLPADQCTRSSHHHEFRHLTANTDTFRNSFFPQTIPEWNSIDSDPANCSSVDTFCARLQVLHRSDWVALRPPIHLPICW